MALPTMARESEEGNSASADRSEVGDDNMLDFDYRSSEDWSMNDSDDSSVEELNVDEIIFEKNLRERYGKSVSAQNKLGIKYEPESSEILSDLALSMELVCLSTGNTV